MKPFWLFVCSACLFFAVQSAGALEACTVTDKEFLHQVTSSSDWLEVHAVFKHNFPACPDNELYADGYTNMVVGVLAERWSETAMLGDLMVKDEGFKQFVLRHIDTSAGEENLRRVLHSAQANCPKNSAQLCKEIALRSKRALSDKKK